MPDSTICRPEHVYYCFATLESTLLRLPAPDASQFISEADRQSHYPLFITWNKYEDEDDETPHLRGCIGCFSALPLEEGLREYALTSALKDSRFSPITKAELPLLQCGYAPLPLHVPTPSNPSLDSVSLLTPFEPARDPLDWTLGTHGIHITFHDPSSGRRYSGTYLPDVAVEQGWTKEEAVRSLMRKAGWRGDSSVGGEVWRGIEMKTYRSEKCKRDWTDYVAWKGERGL